MNVVRAWKDPEYRDGLAAAPEHPSGNAGMTRLAISELSAAGAAPASWLACATKTLTLTNLIYCTVTLNVCN